jgi:hypothetical protein
MNGSRAKLCLALMAALSAGTGCGRMSSESALDGGLGSSGGGSSGGSSGGSGSGGAIPPGGSSSGGVVIPQPDDGGTVTIPPQTLAVAKVDLLFMIDNSASMGDKQEYLNQAIPDLVARLVTPNCIDPANPSTVYGQSTLDGSGNAVCTQGSPEFPAVRDMHIGVVSSSLGSRLGDKQPADGSGGACLPTSTITVNGITLSNHDDDSAHLLTRSSDPKLLPTDPPTEVPLPDAASGFLAWFPGNGASTDPAPIKATAQLETDFSDLLAGVHQYGCGIESQLESWYRFLIQPDPYASLDLDSSSHAVWVGVATTILKERHDFLRPDSLVAIVDLTDENDSEIDVRSVSGQGYLFMSSGFSPPHGTAACSTNPSSGACTTQGSADKAPYSAPTDWGYDLNLRHVHMKQKYGIDPQFPISRYVNGLTSTTVPDRAGEYPVATAPYAGTNDCTNPLFAAALPDGTATDAATLCKLPPGKRGPSLVYYLHIGGVPESLLHYTPGGAATNELTSADWVKILGNDPTNYDFSGIDPHMIESYQPRPGLPDPSSASNADPISGREWITNQGPHVDLNVDREYACIFKLATPRDCSRNASGLYNVPGNGYSCDCSATGLTAEQLSPVCDPANPNSQLYAKAYPTVRELLLAKLIGPQGVVASICPTDVVDNASGTDPLYGYRPAVSNLIDRMRPALAYTGP